MTGTDLMIEKLKEIARDLKKMEAEPKAITAIELAIRHLQYRI